MAKWLTFLSQRRNTAHSAKTALQTVVKLIIISNQMNNPKTIHRKKHRTSFGAVITKVLLAKASNVFSSECVCYSTMPHSIKYT